MASHKFEHSFEGDVAETMTIKNSQKIPFKILQYKKQLYIYLNAGVSRFWFKSTGHKVVQVVQRSFLCHHNIKAKNKTMILEIRN